MKLSMKVNDSFLYSSLVKDLPYRSDQQLLEQNCAMVRRLPLLSKKAGILFDEQAIVQALEHQGYFLLPKAHPNCPGYGGLVISVPEETAALHNDLRSIRLQINDESNQPSWETITSETNLQRSKKVVAGRLIFKNHRNEKTEFFSFGGQLNTLSILGATVCEVSSQAPILELFEPRETVADQLVFEFEGMLAKLGIKQDFDNRDVSRRLAKMEPMALYTAGLQAILNYYQQNTILSRCFHELYVSILREKEWLIKTSQWPDFPITLDKLLA